MSTDVNTIANLADNMHRPANKQKAFESLKSLIDKLDREVVVEHASKLADLYSYFLPPVPAKPKLLHQKAAKFMAKNDVRHYLNHIYVKDDGYLVATDGHRLLQSAHKSDFEPGYYNRAMEKMDFDAKYPDVDRVIEPARKQPLAEVVSTELVERAQGKKLLWIYRVELKLLGSGGETITVGIQKPYWDIAMACLKNNYTIRASTSNTSVYLTDVDVEIVLMPIRL